MTDLLSEFNEEFQYPIEFEVAISELFVRIPQLTANSDDYIAECKRHDDGTKLEITFEVNQEGENFPTIACKIFDFVQFVGAQDIDGVKFNNDTGILTFDNAGYIAIILQEYIDKNPENMTAEQVQLLDEELCSVFKEHAPDLVTTNEASPQSEIRYPLSVRALNTGFNGYLQTKDILDEINLVFRQGNDTQHSLEINPKNMEGTDFPDPDLIEKLEETYDELEILSSSEVQIVWSENVLKIISSSYLATAGLLKNIYIRNGICGTEDVYQNWDDEVFLQNRFGELYGKVFDEDEAEVNPELASKFRSKILSHFYEELSDQINSYSDDTILFLAPMGSFISKNSLEKTLGRSCGANAPISIEQIEAWVKLEHQENLTHYQRHFRIH